MHLVLILLLYYYFCAAFCVHHFCATIKFIHVPPWHSVHACMHNTENVEINGSCRDKAIYNVFLLKIQHEDNTA